MMVLIGKPTDSGYCAFARFIALKKITSADQRRFSHLLRNASTILSDMYVKYSQMHFDCHEYRNHHIGRRKTCYCCGEIYD